MVRRSIKLACRFIRVSAAFKEDKDRDARTPANLLTPAVTDPNAHTPESKGFLVKVEKA